MLHPFLIFCQSVYLIQSVYNIHILNGGQCRSGSVGFFRSQLIWLYTVCKGRTYLGSAGSRLNNSLFYFLFNSYNYAYIHSSHNIIIQFLAFRFGKISYKWSILYCDVLAGKNNLPFFFFFFFFCLFVSSSLLSSVFKWIYSHMYNTILTFCLLV